MAPALVVPVVGEALAESHALRIYVCNLVTKPGQTDGYSVCDFADEIERLAGTKFLDAVVFNTEAPSERLLKKYAADGELAVTFDQEALENAHYVAIGAPLISGKIWRNKNKSDPISAHRTLIRHDPTVVANTIFGLYNERGRQE